MHRPYLDIDDRVDALLLAERRMPDDQRAEYQRRFVMGWLHHELAVEGLVTCENDLLRALAGQDGRDWCDGVLLDHVRHYRAAVHEIRNAAVRRTPIDVAWIEHLDDTLAGGPVKDRYRVEDGATEQYKHDVAPPGAIRAELDAIVREIESRAHTQHPLQLAVLVHYRLVRCWPFEARSAIVARMVANRILLQHGYPPIIFPAHDRQRYYHALHYDISRLHDLALESLQTQLENRERAVRACRASQRELRAS